MTLTPRSGHRGKRTWSQRAPTSVRFGCLTRSSTTGRDAWCWRTTCARSSGHLTATVARRRPSSPPRHGSPPVSTRSSRPERRAALSWATAPRCASGSGRSIHASDATGTTCWADGRELNDRVRRIRTPTGTDGACLLGLSTLRPLNRCSYWVTASNSDKCGARPNSILWRRHSRRGSVMPASPRSIHMRLETPRCREMTDVGT